MLRINTVGPGRGFLCEVCHYSINWELSVGLPTATGVMGGVIDGVCWWRNDVIGL